MLMVDLSVPAAFGIEIRREVSLASLTTMKVGGKAEYFAVVGDLQRLTQLIRWARGEQLPYFVLGGGSNILISDAGINGLVIHNCCRLARVDESLAGEESGDSRLLIAESGAAMAGAARVSVRAGLTGLEWGVSVPGTIGGAVIGNAGAHGGEVVDSLEEALILDADGDEVIFRVEDFDYAYRNSVLKRRKPLQAGFNPVVLSATFRLSRGDVEEIRQRADVFLAHRRSTQPVEPSLGSTFENPSGDYAGRLIEAASLKGTRIGGIEISRTHANFLINPGGEGTATAADVMALITLIEEKVEKQFGVRLKREIQLAGTWE